MVCSAAADETLRFWKVFENRNNDQTNHYSSHSNQHSNKSKSINGLNLRIR